jgi:glutathione S-transferase
MKLYTADLSPFAARVRLALYAKGLDVTFDYPKDGLKSDAYLAVNPLGKMPALVLDDGTVIIESDTILEYLEDAFPEPALRPRGPVQAARARLVARIGDLYIAAPMTGLFKQLFSAERDPVIVDYEVARVRQGVAHLEAVLDDQGLAAGPDLSTADCSLWPVICFFSFIEGVFKTGDLTAEAPRLSAYRGRMAAHPLGRRVADEIASGLEAMRKR